MFAIITGCQDHPGSKQNDFETICNPVNISYRFSIEKPSRREAADPTVILFKDKYYLFASKSGGYWHSDDLMNWKFLETSEIPTEEYAPTALALKDTLYFLASSTEKSTIYKTADPLTGKWSVAKEELDMPVWDPAFFLDDDHRLYLFWGCSNQTPIYGVEIDYEKHFSFKGDPVELIFANPAQYGWEVPGDYNTRKEVSPWIEGAWLNKYKNNYYLQYSGPGTEYKSYADGVYISKSPLGPYHIAPHNPFAYMPEGFTAGAGHGSTFEDKLGNYWHIGTSTISVKHLFERRLSLFPAFFDQQGTLHTITRFGDYPFIVPRKRVERFENLFPGWMLLSYGKDVIVSSYIDSLPPSNMTDENIRTYWAAKSGESHEYAILDLGEQYQVYSLQINFAEHNTEIYGREKNIYYQYLTEYSADNKTWESLADKSNNTSDNSHDYIQLPEKVDCRYLRIKNIKMPGGNFAISGFRVFGKGNGDAPAKISKLEANRNQQDRRSIRLEWEKSELATGYNINYGTDKNMMYHNYMVYQDTILIINSLNTNQKYFFSIESFNENGITSNGILITAE